MVPRSIVRYLQDAIAEKELDLKRRHIDVGDGAATPESMPESEATGLCEGDVSSSSDVDAGDGIDTDANDSSNSTQPTPLARWLIDTLDRATTTPQFVDTPAGFPMDLFLFSSSHLPHLSTSSSSSSAAPATVAAALLDADAPAHGDRTDLSQIPRHIVRLLMHNYVKNILPLYPFLDAEDLWARLLRVYPEEGEGEEEAGGKTAEETTTGPSPHDILFISAVLCISIMTSRFSDSHRIASASANIFRNALALTHHLTAASIENLQGFMLLSQYSYLMPQSTSIWDVVGLAMRMAVELGLHRDPGDGGGHLSAAECHLRRRLFWCVYEMDRSIAYTSHRRLSNAEDAITTQFPAGSARSCHICVVRIRRIQAEITAVNYHGTLLGSSQDTQDSGGTAYAAWVAHTERRLEAWRDGIKSQRATGPEWYNIAVNHALVFLHRPSPRNPRPSAASLVTCYTSAAAVIAGYWEHAHSGFLKYSWHAVHQGFESAIVLLYCLRTCTARLCARHGIRRILETVHLGSSLFALLSQIWAKALPCYETYERLKSGVLQKVLRGTDPDEAAGGAGGAGDVDPPPVSGPPDELDRLILPPEEIARITGAWRRLSNAAVLCSIARGGRGEGDAQEEEQAHAACAPWLPSGLLSDGAVFPWPAQEASVLPPWYDDMVAENGGSFIESLDAAMAPAVDWDDFSSLNEASFTFWTM